MSALGDSRAAFIGLLALVGVVRLLEMRLSRRHQRALAGRGVRREPEPAFAAMVALHVGVLAGAAVEVLALERPLLPALAAPALALALLASALRWWVIRTMGQHWNVQVMASSRALGVVTGGPYRFIRHPNYVAVFVELAALPLVHGAYLAAVAGALLHLPILARRIALEERVLAADPAYCAAMGGKPRFIPAIGRGTGSGRGSGESAAPG